MRILQHRRRRASILLLILVAMGALSACGTSRAGVQKKIVSTKHHAPSGVVPSHQRTHSAHRMNPCAGNRRGTAILVSISRRRLWACARTRERYEAPVITGMEKVAADLTPGGVYRISAKETNLYLDGSDSTGSWHDRVHFWMPFLTNRYGVYGFHDATWRKPSDFGSVSPYSIHASHGCVELPLRAAKWLYGWATVGTTVRVTR